MRISSRNFSVKLFDNLELRKEEDVKIRFYYDAESSKATDVDHYRIRLEVHPFKRTIGEYYADTEDWDSCIFGLQGKAEAQFEYQGSNLKKQTRYYALEPSKQTISITEIQEEEGA